MIKIVMISDTHRQENFVKLFKGDILIHAGDFDIYNQNQLDNVIDWFKSLDYEHIIFISGNHDLYMEQLYKNKIKCSFPDNVHYLMNNSIEVNNINFWGSPFSPTFGRGWAFNGDIDELKKIWNTIPEDTDIVISHCNCFGINDQVNGISQGCPALRDKIKEIKPAFHVSGHIHEQGFKIYYDEHTTHINASVLDENYKMTNKPIVVNYGD